MKRAEIPGLTRRGFLRCAAGTTLALPLLQSLGCAQTPVQSAARAVSGYPKRFVVVYIPNGNFNQLPPGLDFAGSFFEPLIPFKSKLLLLEGLDLSVHNKPPGEPHQQGMAFLTGRSLNTGTQVGGDGTLAGWASGISVDQQIANAIGKATPHASLHFGVQSTIYGGTEVRTVISYRGADQPVANDDSPYSMAKLVFGELGADPLGLSKLRARRRSVLDQVVGRFTRLNAQLGSDDRKKLEQHLSAVREVEQRLDTPGGTLGGYCQVPKVGTPLNISDPVNYPVVGKLQTDLLVMALACDMTRVATLQWSASTNNRPYPFLKYDDGSGAVPIVGDEHVLGHAPDSDVHAWGKLAVIRRWYMEQLAYLLGKLDSMQEGEGTMLDNTVILLASEIARGNTHSHSDTPFLLAGTAGGYFSSGRRISYPGEVPHNNLLVSLMNSMGIAATTFGDPEYCSGPLTNLTRA